jgi:hypothetical protein
VCNDLQQFHDDVELAEPVYLEIDFVYGAGFTLQFDRPDLSPSEALGSRLMNAFYKVCCNHKWT